ncbi:MAG: SspB family protein [Janthinobacterium lividum]
MEDDEDGAPPSRPDSLLPYDAWTEESLRHVVVRALAHVGAQGMPGEHHFYISFSTTAPGVIVPQRLLAQYPTEMTIVLQHQFWDLQVDEPGFWFSVGLSFGGIPTTLHVPFGAVTAFADPHVQFGLRFRPQGEEAANDAAEAPSAATPEPLPLAEEPADAPAEAPQVVSLDAFRKRTHKD